MSKEIQSSVRAPLSSFQAKCDENQKGLRILRRKQIETKIGLSRSSIYSRLNPNAPCYDPTFPQPVSLGSGTNPPIGWVESEVDTWIEAQIKNSRPAA